MNYPYHKTEKYSFSKNEIHKIEPVLGAVSSVSTQLNRVSYYRFVFVVFASRWSSLKRIYFIFTAVDIAPFRVLKLSPCIIMVQMICFLICLESFKILGLIQTHGKLLMASSYQCVELYTVIWNCLLEWEDRCKISGVTNRYGVFWEHHYENQVLQTQ